MDPKALAIIPWTDDSRSLMWTDKIHEAVRVIKTRGLPTSPWIGVVLGSGLGAFVDQLKQAIRIPYQDIPHFPVSTVVGHAGELVIGEINGVWCAVMSGRVHYYEGYDPAQVVFPVRVLAKLGVKHLIVTNASGAINTAFSPGDMMVITDHINFTGTNPLRGPNELDMGPRFPDMSAAYGPIGQQALHDAAAAINVTLRSGVYVGVTGPSYETPAEIRMFRMMGADAVGMSTVAEVIAASHLGLHVAGLAVLTNHAAGVTDQPLSHEEVTRESAKVRHHVVQVLTGAITRLASLTTQS